jgi:hypothetical protein
MLYLPSMNLHRRLRYQEAHLQMILARTFANETIVA